MRSSRLESGDAEHSRFRAPPRGRGIIAGMSGAHGFQDHFSTQADAYARFRPTYPAALFDWLAAGVGHARYCGVRVRRGQARTA